MSESTFEFEHRGYEIHLTEHAVYTGPLGYTFKIRHEGKEVHVSRYYPCRLEHVHELIDARLDVLESVSATNVKDWERAVMAFEAGAPCDVRLM